MYKLNKNKFIYYMNKFIFICNIWIYLEIIVRLTIKMIVET